jgi:hypothetical protein
VTLFPHGPARSDRVMGQSDRETDSVSESMGGTGGGEAEEVQTVVGGGLAPTVASMSVELGLGRWGPTVGGGAARWPDREGHGRTRGALFVGSRVAHT